MTREDVQAWLDAYVAAWKSYDADAIGALFAEDAEYRYHPADEPIRGRAAIVSSWVEPNGDASGRDATGTYDATYRPWAIDGRRAVATGSSSYYSDSSQSKLERIYDNCYLLEFDDAGACRSFTEFFRLRPDPAS